MDLGQLITVYLGIFLIFWYVGASAYNRRLGVRTYRWLQAGMATLGKITQAKWIGSSGSGARIGVQNAARPFRRVEVTYLLETRELLPLWLINLLRGRRDAMIVRADLRSVPQGELEILPAGDARLRSAPSASKQNPWSLSDTALPFGLRAAWRGRNTDRALERLMPFLQQDGGAIRRLSLARTSPHVILEAHLRGLMGESAQSFLERLAGVMGRPEEQSETEEQADAGG